MKLKNKNKKKNYLIKILFYINIFFSFLILLSYASVYISPDNFSLFAIFGLAYPFLLLVNILFVIFWALTKKINFLISLIVVIIGFSHLKDTFQLHLSNNETNDNSFKLMSYNVRLFNKYDWLVGQNTTKNILNYLKEENSDILCIQEFYSDISDPKLACKSDIQKFDKTKYSYIEYGKISGKTYNYGIAIFSKFPIINKGALKYDEEKNICIYSDLQIKQDTIRIYNCHFQSIQLGYDDYSFIDKVSKNDKPDHISKNIIKILKKLRRAYKIRALQTDIVASHILTSPYPVIVCGDFNDTPVSYTYHKINKNLHDAFIKNGSGIGNTYVRNFSFFRIDYILHSKKIISSNYKTGKVRLSDHYPISCWFEIK